MKKKINIVIKLLLIIIIISFVFIGLNCYATDVINPNTYNPNGHLTEDNNVNTAIGQIVGIIRVIGSVASVGVVIVIGIRYMTSSVDGKAEYKKTMMQYLIGAILIFIGSNIVGIIYDLATNMLD